MTRGFSASVVALCICLQAQPAAASSVVGGSDIVPRFTRDGVANITFIDLSNSIQTDSTLTGWNIWAQDYAFTWPYSNDPRELKLIIFRQDGTDTFAVVGKSALETVVDWNQAYHFDLASPIAAQAGDYIGWYYPNDNYPVPGGVISFDSSGSTQTAFLYGDEIDQTTPALTSFIIEPRTYSINVEGVPAVPEPSTALLVGTGLAALAGSIRRRKRRGRPTAE